VVVLGVVNRTPKYHDDRKVPDCAADGNNEGIDGIMMLARGWQKSILPGVEPGIS
jgi:hypothetical protein